MNGGIFCIIMPVLQNTVMDLNNVMCVGFTQEKIVHQSLVSTLEF